MAQQYTRSTEVTKHVKPRPVGRQPQYDGLYMGVVKQVLDSSGTGKLKVWIADMGTMETDRSSWITVNYCSPFFGSTPVGKNEPKETYQATQTSYGMWFVPPDVGNVVIVGFINGNKANGFWLGSVPSTFANRMVPSVASGKAHTDSGKAHELPIPVPQAEYNKKLSNNAPQRSLEDQDDKNYLRPYAKYHSEGLVRQGLVEDEIRGVDFSSARRGQVSNVYGISTPGPKVTPDNPQSTRRKGGSTFVMDDNPTTEKIRLRTRSGSQFLLDETNGIVYVVNRDGTSWVELDATGNIDMFAQGSVTIRSEQDVNIRADKNIRMEAGQNVYVKAAKDHDGDKIVGQDSGQGGDIYFEARNDVLGFVKNNAHLTVAEGKLDIDVATTTKFKSGSDIDFKSDANIRQESAGTFDTVAGGDYKLDASAIGLTSSNIDLALSGAMRVSGTSTADGTMFAPDFQAPTIGLVGHKHAIVGGSSSIGQSAAQAGGLGGGTGSASGPGATSAQDPELVTEEPTQEKTNIENEDLGLPNIKTAIDNLINRVRETEIKTLLPRWLTREPCPEKKKS